MISGMTGILKEHEFRIASVLVLLESALLLWSSFTAGPVVEAYSFLYLNSATLGHLMAYIVYGCLWGMMFLMKGNTGRKSIVLAIIVGSSFGALNEIIQSGVPGRYMDLMDIRVNIIGSFIGGLISTRIRFRAHQAAS